MKIESVPHPIISRLHLPTTVADSVLPFFKANPESLSEWLETLPKLNPAECCRKILPAMETMNLTTIDGETRFRMLECLRNYLFDLISSTETQFLDASFPMSEKVSEMAYFAVHAQKAMADAYQLAIGSPEFVTKSSAQPAADSGSEPRSKSHFTEELQAIAIHRALQSLGRVLLRRAQIYRANTSTIWDEINALYLLAEQHLMHQIPIEDNQNPHVQRSSIEAIFKRLHFFTLAVPNRFRQRDIQSIYLLLSETADKIRLSDIHASDQEQANFFVALNSDMPSLHISKKISQDGSLRYFHTRAFVEHLMSDAVIARGKEELLNLDSQKTRMPERTVRRLLQCWHQTVSRQFSRQEEKQPVTIYPGLQNIIKKFLYVPVAEKAKAKMGRGDIDSRFSIAHLELLPTSDHDGRDASFDSHSMRSERSVESMLKASKSNTSADDIWKKAALKKPQGEAQKIAAEIGDVSAKGYQINLNPDKQPLIRVGDLLGIQQSPDQMEIAVVRRMQIPEDGHVHIGVELIAPNARVARIVNKDENIRSRSVLLLPGIPAIKQPISLITVSKLDVPGNQIELLIDKTRGNYQLLKLLESNPAFVHYTLQKLE